MTGRCIMCGRRLKDPESRARGYGPKCWRAHLASLGLLTTGRRKRKKGTVKPGEMDQIPGQMSIYDFLEIPDEEEDPEEKN